MKLKGLLTSKTFLLYSLFLLSFLLRLLLTYLEFIKHGTSNWADAMLYLDHGLKIAGGNWFPGYGLYPYMVVGPVLPLIIAGAKLLTGAAIWPVLVMNCLISALLVYVLYYLGERLIGAWAGWLLALWSVGNFGFIRLNNQLVKEPLVIFLCPLIILLLVDFMQRRRVWGSLIGSSLLYGVLIHTDERYLVYAPFLLGFVFAVAQQGKRWQRAGLWALVLLLAMLPWTLRNFRQFGELVLISPRTTAFTSMLWGHNWAAMHVNSTEGESDFYQRMQKNAEKAMHKYGVAPRRFGRWEKYYMAFYHYWKPTYIKLNYIMYGNRPVIWSRAHNLNSMLMYGIFLPFYALGLGWAFVKRNWLMLWLGGLAFLHGLLHTAMIWPLERYRLPMNFLIVIVAMWVVTDLWKANRGDAHETA